MGARALYYYLREDGKKFATVCLILGEGDSSPIARGISICSPEDPFIKRRGRAIALGRAMLAFHHARNQLYINYREFKYGTNIGVGLLAEAPKASYQPVLPPFELNLIKKATEPRQLVAV